MANPFASDGVNFGPLPPQIEACCSRASSPTGGSEIGRALDALAALDPGGLVGWRVVADLAKLGRR
jgi:hypothetical protein